jgi:hypothetical protein
MITICGEKNVGFFSQEPMLSNLLSNLFLFCVKNADFFHFLEKILLKSLHRSKFFKQIFEATEKFSPTKELGV